MTTQLRIEEISSQLNHRITGNTEVVYFKLYKKATDKVTIEKRLDHCNIFEQKIFNSKYTKNDINDIITLCDLDIFDRKILDTNEVTDFEYTDFSEKLLCPARLIRIEDKVKE